jgi:hypothetical protein
MIKNKNKVDGLHSNLKASGAVNITGYALGLLGGHVADSSVKSMLKGYWSFNSGSSDWNRLRD